MLYKHPHHASPLMVLLLIFNQFIKSLSLWRAARNRNRGWFLALAFINTLGILDFIYIKRFPIKRSRRSGIFDKMYP